MHQAPKSSAAGRLAKLARVVGSALFAAWFAVAAWPAAAQTAESIRSYSSDIEVQADGRIIVTETIEYEFPTPRHGIYRDLPLEYCESQFRCYRIPLTVTGVVDEKGEPLNYEEISGKSGLRLKIGDADKTVSGVRTYVITYDAAGALRYFADHDELFWNVTGTNWEVPIGRVAAQVRLPDNIPTKDVTLKCYSGAQGSKKEECLKNTQGHVANFAAGGFGPKEGLTIVVGWPPGLVAKLLPETTYPFKQYLIYLIPLAALLFMLWRWWAKGRDPRERTLVVQYDPPDKLPPAEVGTLIDSDAGLKEVTATIVDLAVRGYLKIKETELHGLLTTGKDYEFQKTKDWASDTSLTDYEREILGTIFGLGDIVPVSQIKSRYAFSESLPKIKTMIYDRTVQKGYFAANPETVRKVYVSVGVTLGIIGWFAGAEILGGLTGTGVHAHVAWYLTCAVILLFGLVMPRLTDAGMRAHEHAEGFREYLSRAEKYRLQWQESTNVFEKFLPYAMVYGVVDKWSKSFEGIGLSKPDWYEGRAFSSGVFNAAIFNSTFNSLGASMNSAVMSSPSKSSSGSGFSGGGFSGGGGGGGGGGSW